MELKQKEGNKRLTLNKTWNKCPSYKNQKPMYFS